MSDVVLARCSWGDWVIGRRSKDGTSVENVGIIQFAPSQVGGMQVAILPVGFPFDSGFDGSLPMTALVYFVDKIPTEIENKYIEVSSGILLSGGERSGSEGVANDKPNLKLV